MENKGVILILILFAALLPLVSAASVEEGMTKLTHYAEEYEIGNIDYDLLYDLIHTSEKEMEGTRIESPPWDKQIRPMKVIKDIQNGIKMYFKVRKMLNEAEYIPEDSKKDV